MIYRLYKEYKRDCLKHAPYFSTIHSYNLEKLSASMGCGDLGGSDLNGSSASGGDKAADTSDYSAQSADDIEDDNDFDETLAPRHPRRSAAASACWAAVRCRRDRGAWL